MGECIGLDFGTTYTTLSRVIKDDFGNEKLEAIDFGTRRNPLYDVPTILAINDTDRNDIEIGKSAISRMLSSNYKTYRGFKMLLQEENHDVLKGKGYNNEITPETAAELFLIKLFSNAKDKLKDSIEKVIVGVPFVWTVNNDHSNDQKKQTVVNLVKKASGADEVEFRAEPELAGAYFANKLKDKDLTLNGEVFQGHILVIDYGGGTLDITLCRASKDEDGSCRLDPIGPGWGAGENHDIYGSIGNAGIRFMEKVADITLENNGVPETEIIQNHIDNTDIPMTESKKSYSAFVNSIEEAIINSADIPEKICKRKYKDSRLEGYKEEVSDVNAGYKGQIYHVLYGTLIEAFEECKNELDAELKKVKEWIDKYNQENDSCKIDYKDSTSGKFKVATIGGFCNFKLTYDHITQEIDWLESAGFNDRRYENMDEEDRAVAVAHGAALLSNDMVLIPHKFPYSLYVYGEKGENVKIDNRGNVHYDSKVNKDLAFCFFRENETYFPGIPVFLKTYKGSKPHHVGASKIPYMQRKRANDMKEAKAFKPSIEIALPKNHEWVYLAIAMERNENLTLYVYDQKIFDEQLDEAEKSNPTNKALIGPPLRYPDIDTLMGSLHD